MIRPTFPSYHFEQQTLNALVSSVSKALTLIPKTGSDGICRLQMRREEPFPRVALPAFLPLKKELIPPCEKVWSYKSGHFRHAEEFQTFAVVGLPLCDLQAIWYLDQVFVGDEHYQARRAQAFLVGLPCKASPECRCDSQLMPITGDLVIGEERVWALSLAGEKMVKSCGCFDSEKRALPWPEKTPEKRPVMTEKQFHESADAEIWNKEAQQCLSCGACSAVCPTCYCFDLLDTASLDGTVTRKRAWDNCFFSEHGEVAGGHDFRPNRASRLRFRLEHKFFGFGELRGQKACVGCGRCRNVCPVNIDLDHIATQIAEEPVL